MDFDLGLATGDRLGPYVLGTRIAQGGMGAIYQAEHEETGRAAAVKVLTAWLSSDSGRLRFDREVRACASLRHPNIVEILDFGESEDGTMWYAMELLRGFELPALVRRSGGQPSGRVAALMSQIAGALAEVHQLGMVHRDIKPANILVCQIGDRLDVAKLVDFGLVTAVNPPPGRQRLTAEGRILGTPRYCAPELLSGEGLVTPSSDIYALGLVTYYLLTGAHAFDSKDFVELLQRQKSERPTPPSELCPNVPAELEAIVMSCLEKQPEARPESARALEAQLASCGGLAPWGAAEARAWWSDNPLPACGAMGAGITPTG